MPNITPTRFHEQLRDTFHTARSMVTQYGHAEEILILFDGRGRRQMFLNQANEPYSRQPELVADLVRALHATAAIHVCETWLGWLTATDPGLNATPPGDRPDREEALIVTGAWPAMGIEQTYTAQIVRPAEGTVDVVDLDLSAALERTGIPQASEITAKSWLVEALPTY